MKDNKYTLIINYPVLAAGGIEQTLAPMMRWFLNNGHRVIWITTKHHIQQVAFRDILEDPRLEIVISGWSRFLGSPKIAFEKDERVIMLTCTALKYVVSERIRRKAATRNFMHYYVIAHFTGSIYYPDTGLKTKLGKGIAYRFWKKILQRLVDQNSILAFSPKHLQSYEDHYGIVIPDKDSRMIPRFESVNLSVDSEELHRKCAQRKDLFRIATCARFEFPHKAYILGLVDAFAAIRERYPQAVLRIIGYGAGEQELRSKIQSLPEHIQKDIELIGMVSPDELKGYYKDSHLVVGLAGSVVTGVLCGVPSLIARHYCGDCETYGFFADAPDKTLCEDSGDAILPYIESCITMPDEDYAAQVKRGFEVLSGFKSVGTDYFFRNFREQTPILVRSAGDILLGWILHIVCSICRRFER